jgi:pilus assembly protein Flp/PilA
MTARNALGALVRRLCRDCSGATAVEYGLIVAAIAAAIVGIVFLIGDDLVFVFELIEKKLQQRM